LRENDEGLTAGKKNGEKLPDRNLNRLFAM